jgi:hypothetical protein
MREWSVGREFDDADLRVVSDGVLQHGRTQAVGGDAKPLACLVREGGAVIAGASGRTEASHFILAALLNVLPCVALGAEASASSSESLYVLSVQGKVAEDGTLLTMSIRETKRTPDLSIVAVEQVSGGSASALLLVRGFCGLMHARGAQVAVAEQFSENPVQFQMTFPKTAKIEDTKGLPRMVLSTSDCARIQSPHE